MAPNLRDPFLAGLSAQLATEMGRLADTDGQLLEAWETATSAWPELHLAAETFAPYLAERLPADLPPAQRIGALVVPDLYLAFGCASGDATAISLFERHLRPEIEGTLARLTAPAHLVHAGWHF